MRSEVERLLADYRESAPVNIEALIENLGIGLDAAADLPDGISGHIKREDSGKYVIRANRSEHIYRRRFTMAHELGHFILHKSILDLSGGVNDNVMYRTDRDAAAYNSHIHAIHERQANSFAANLLMPDEKVREIWQQEANASGHVAKTPDLPTMYRRFEVSPSAMKWKLNNMELEVRD
ncbi:MAG: ImmA/IrrE family metallo-endopeptidase [Sphingomonas sp.]|nr:ImmA/IrrE family metallo-endopeptidase [Sphingomonas sp.]